MDFFASQELARRKTRLMLVLFGLAVLGLILGVYALILGILALNPQQVIEGSVDHAVGRGGMAWDWLQPEILVGVSVVVGLVVSAGSLYKVAQLRGGGSAVAAMLNARRLLPNSTDIHERRLLNVVEEMAIASGTPVPPVFVLDHEPGINAFAAGYTVDDAIIGVNRGTLLQLNRDELQGVVAHEFSHILNGDMRMSVRMIGILHGIQLVALIGYFILRSMSGVSGRSSSRSNGKGDNGRLAIFLLGVGLVILGSIGLFFARLIKASVSRQREYLADASAVQFTRNPEGIAGALKMIGAVEAGSAVRTNNAELVSHMYFADMFDGHIAHLFATHPPLVPRIQKIEPRFDGDFQEYIKLRQRRLEQRQQQERTGTDSRERLARLGDRFRLPTADLRFPLDPTLLIAGIGDPSVDDVDYSAQIQGRIPEAIAVAIREVFSARCVALAMLLSDQPEIRAKQQRIIQQREGNSTLDTALGLRPAAEALAPEIRLPVFEVLQGTLAGMSDRQYAAFRGTVEAMSAADDRLSLFEFFLHHHLINYLDRRFGKSLPQHATYADLRGLEADVAAILLLLVSSGHRDRAIAEQALTAAWSSLELQQTPPPVHDPPPGNLNSTSQSLVRLAHATPEVKRKILSAAAIAITFDQQVTTAEAELFRAFSESLDCPVPPIVATEFQSQRLAADPPSRSR